MRFGVLGPVAVWTADGRAVGVPEVKVRALLANLLVHEGRPVSVDRLVDDLWGDRPPGNPANTVQTKVSQLRKALEAAEPGGRELVVRQPPGYLLRGETDAERFRELTTSAAATRDPRARAALLTDALALWRGPALADFADFAFAAHAIGRLEEERLAAVERQAEARLELGEHDLGLDDLVARHPLRERLRALQMRARYRAGRQGEALAGYDELRKLLAEELGLEPGPELVALHQAILRQDPALDAPPRRTNLPTPLTELIGRTEAVRDVRALVGRARLVTLTGPGGVGKTRLALETARQLDNAWLVEFAGLAASSDPVEVTASVLGVREDPSSGPLVELLVEAVRDKDVVLVLDNCEQLVEPIAALADRLLRAAPRLRVLATSQEPLGLAGEALWPVPPLDIPSAAELFTARAQSTAGGADNHTTEDPDTVAEICRRLDGIPLALELAATKVRALGARELLHRLDDRFRLLSSGHRGAPARQQTLRAMIDWSWDLLTGPERVVLRRLAVHADGCTLEAAEAVCAEDGVDVVDLLARLVDRSLVVVAEGPRYRLLESVAAYCAQRLEEAGEAEHVRLRHRLHYTALAERALLRGPEQRQWLELLDAEAANLRAALDRTPTADQALRLVNALAWYWVLRGRLSEGHRSMAKALSMADASPVTRARAVAWQTGIALLMGDSVDPAGLADDALALFDDVDDPAGLARARWFLGSALIGSGDLSHLERLVDRALEDFRALGDDWGVAAALSARAAQGRPRGDLAAATRDGERSAALFHRLGDRWGQLKAADVLSSLAEIAGDYPKAARLHREGLRMAEELGLGIEASYELSGLGRIALLTGDFEQADEYHRRAMRLAAERSHRRGVQFAEIGLGMGARRQGRLDDAERHLRAWLDWCRQVDGDLGAALILAELGFVAEQRGDAPAALALHQEGYAAASTTGDPRAIALAMEGLAGARALAGDHGEAARLLGAATAARESAGAPLPPAERGDVDRISAVVRRALGERAFDAEFAQEPRLGINA